jgi:hypothetical protein
MVVRERRFDERKTRLREQWGRDADEHTGEDTDEHTGNNRETKSESEKRENKMKKREDYYYNGNFKYKNHNTIEKEHSFPFFFRNGLFTFLFNFKKM